MKFLNQFCLVCLLFCFSCSDDETKEVPIQAGIWDVSKVNETFKDNVLNSRDTSFFEMHLNEDRTGLFKYPDQENKILDWEVIDGEEIHFTIEYTRSNGDKFGSQSSAYIRSSQPDYQEWWDDYRIKPGGSNVWLDGIANWYLTRKE